MRKTITHQGQYKATITVSPQCTIDFTKKPDPVNPDQVFNINSNVNGTLLFNYVNIPPEELLSAVAVVEQLTVDLLSLISGRNNVMGQLIEKGYEL